MIYVMPDIHGNSRRFESVMSQINLKPEDTLYVLGDVIDRYPDGIRILRRLMKMPNVKMILGNHEYMMLNALGDRSDGNSPFAAIQRSEERYRWYRNGGKVTHDYLKHIRKTTRLEIFDYLQELPLNIDVEVNGQKYKLVHGAPAENYLEEHYRYTSAAEFAVWRRWMPSDPDLDDSIVVFGHTPTVEFQDEVPMKIWHAPNGRKIGLDCGSGYPPMTIDGENRVVGRLACLRLDDMAEFYSEEGEACE